MAFDPATAAIGVGTGLLGGVLNLFGASKQAKAAEAAAKAQREAAARAGQGVMDTATEHNRDIVSGADRSSAAVSDAAARAGFDATAATDRSNALIDPYRVAGTNASDLLDKGLSEGGRFNRDPTAADIQLDPGFAARLKFADMGFERGAAARGGAASGTALMDLSRFNQREASSEYDKAFQRFRANRSDGFSYLNTVASRGFDAGAREGDRSIDTSKYSGDLGVKSAVYGGEKVFDAARLTADNANRAAQENGEYITQGGNAEAAGIVGKANAEASKFSGFLGGATTGAGIYNLLQNPKVNYSRAPGSGGG